MRAFIVAAYMSTYSWPERLRRAYMISSVTERRMKRSSSSPWKREKSSGSPMTVPIRMILGILRPIGCAMLVPTITTGMTGAPDSSARRATPVLPRYIRPSGLRVPSG